MSGPAAGASGSLSTTTAGAASGPVGACGIAAVSPSPTKPHIFGIRHLSPAGAWHLRQFLDEKDPKLVLVEGPVDFNDQMENLVHPETRPPFAILAYTADVPVRTILYPFALYSPEYQAVLWCHEHGKICRFMDLPSSVFLALGAEVDQYNSGSGEEERMDVYRALDRQAGEDGHDTFWERTLEQTLDTAAYHEAANLFGTSIRQLSLEQGARQEDDEPGAGSTSPEAGVPGGHVAGQPSSSSGQTRHREPDCETLLREAFMRLQIQKALDEGYAPEDIVVVTGAYHVAGLLAPEAAVEAEAAKLPKAAASHTLMPYSYYRLSTRSGYGAGNKAPAYYELLWENFVHGDLAHSARSYLSRIAIWQREHGNPVSSAAVIEAVRMADSLASLRGSRYPALRDLRDAAVTCLGEGRFSNISLAVADTEIGTAIGNLPEGVSRTSIQEDFYRQLKQLKLEKYRDITAQDLHLDLRENRRVSSEKSAFLDRNRSFFLHQIRVLGIRFALAQGVRQENATWAEHWIVQWTPEAEIELVESALKGDTIAQATSFAMKERVEAAKSMAEIAAVIEDGFTCGMAEMVQYATAALQAMAVDGVAVDELAGTADRLSTVLQYGSIRNLDPEPLKPILQQLFYRACLLLPGACVCDDAASKVMTAAMEKLNRAALAHGFLHQEAWIHALEETAARDDLNTKLSGYAAAILLERSQVDAEWLKTEVSRRLSRGVPADLGAGWFEGLAMKNRYGLIARLSLWESLDQYLQNLTDEEFKRALVFLRRAFADFTAAEKDAIAENLGEIWGVNAQQASEMLNAGLGEEEQAVVENLVESLDDFDFDF